MEILSIPSEVSAYLKKHNLEKKFSKQISLFKNNPFHPGLGTELLEPRNMHVWSFRVDRKYRAIFLFRGAGTIEIIEVNNHYQ